MGGGGGLGRAGITFAVPQRTRGSLSFDPRFNIGWVKCREGEREREG